MNALRLKISLCLVIALIALTSFQMRKSQPAEHGVKDLVKNISWIDNACVKITGSKTVYFDPYNVYQKDSADYIFITHDHYDHFSPKDIEMLVGENTIVFGPECVTKYLECKTRTVKPGDLITEEGITVEVIPSYTIERMNHEKGKGYVGYVLTMDEISYYVPGDADFIPEMKEINTDVAFLPVCGVYMMDVEDAVKAATAINPEVVIPFHYGSVLGTKENALEFKKLYSGKTVIL